MTQPWTLDHRLTWLPQTESRPGELTAEGEQWMECRPTGKARVVCTCGYSTDLVDRSALPSNDDLREHHNPRI
jgi:hypothetical protein